MLALPEVAGRAPHPGMPRQEGLGKTAPRKESNFRGQPPWMDSCGPGSSLPFSQLFSPKWELGHR